MYFCSAGGVDNQLVTAVVELLHGFILRPSGNLSTCTDWHETHRASHQINIAMYFSLRRVSIPAIKVKVIVTKTARVCSVGRQQCDGGIEGSILPSGT